MMHSFKASVLAVLCGVAWANFASAAPVVGVAPADPALLPALGLSVGQVTAVSNGSGGYVYSGQIDPSIYQAYANGTTNQLPVLVLAYSSTNGGVGTNNAVFAQPGSGISFNGGTSFAGANIGGAGAYTPKIDTFTPGFNSFDFFTSSDPTYQGGNNSGLVIFQAYPNFGNTLTPLTDATLTLNTFYVNPQFAAGYKLDVYEINPALGIGPADATYSRLTSVASPEPGSAMLIAIGSVSLLARRRRI